MQVAKWGNSLAVRLPAALVRQLGLKEGDQIEIVAKAGQIAVDRKRDVDEALARLRSYRGSLPPDFKLDREVANARGE